MKSRQTQRAFHGKRRWKVFGLAILGVSGMAGALPVAAATASDAVSAAPDAAGADSAPADADAGISEVLVTSRNREESSQEVPIPISVIGSQALVRGGTLSIGFARSWV
jgi:iron complex outermembrane receptor protein